jgi:hypothetical protein
MTKIFISWNINDTRFLTLRICYESNTIKKSSEQQNDQYMRHIKRDNMYPPYTFRTYLMLLEMAIILMTCYIIEENMHQNYKKKT